MAGQTTEPLKPEDVVKLIHEDDAIFAQAIDWARKTLLQCRQSGESSTVVVELYVVRGLLDKWRKKYDGIGGDRKLKERMQ